MRSFICCGSFDRLSYRCFDRLSYRVIFDNLWQDRLPRFGRPLLFFNTWILSEACASRMRAKDPLARKSRTLLRSCATFTSPDFSPGRCAWSESPVTRIKNRTRAQAAWTVTKKLFLPALFKMCDFTEGRWLTGQLIRRSFRRDPFFIAATGSSRDAIFYSRSPNYFRECPYFFFGKKSFIERTGSTDMVAMPLGAAGFIKDLSSFLKSCYFSAWSDMIAF